MITIKTFTLNAFSLSSKNITKYFCQCAVCIPQLKVSTPWEFFFAGVLGLFWSNACSDAANYTLSTEIILVQCLFWCCQLYTELKPTMVNTTTAGIGSNTEPLAKLVSKYGIQISNEWKMLLSTWCITHAISRVRLLTLQLTSDTLQQWWKKYHPNSTSTNKWYWEKVLISVVLKFGCQEDS